MASMTIRNLDDSLKQRLRLRAASHGRSMEDEVRDILKIVLASEERRSTDLARSIRQRITELGGLELELIPREAIRDVPGFEG